MIMPANSIILPSTSTASGDLDLLGDEGLVTCKPLVQRLVLRDGECPTATITFLLICAFHCSISTLDQVSCDERRDAHRKPDQRDDDSGFPKETRQPQATRPSGASHISLNTFISSAPSAPSMARWSKLPVALITVAMPSASSTT